MNKILWNSIKSPLRYFWVPAGEDVFAGEYQIENGDGEEASVDLESLIPFEIDGEQAEEIMLGELENMTSELGDLFKGLFNLGKRMVNSELREEDSESDWDSEDDSDSDWDSEDDSDDSDDDSDSDFDDADLEKVLSLFDLDSEDDSDDSEDESDSDVGSLEDILSQFGTDVEGPLTELRELLVKEFGNLGEELDKIGAQAAEQLDSEPGAGQDILRELGHWLINLADERVDTEDEDVVVMEFKPKGEHADNEGDIADAISEEDSDSSSEEFSESSSDEDSAESEQYSHEDSNKNIENDSAVDLETKPATTEVVTEPETELPNATVLKRMTKAQLVELGNSFGITLSMKDTKNTLLEQLETLR